MIWTLRIECVRGRYLEDQWVRVYEVDSQSCFEIRKGRAQPKPPEPRVKYPRQIEAVGPKLRQYG